MASYERIKLDVLTTLRVSAKFVTVQELEDNYQTINQCQLPLKELGYTSLTAFLESFPNNEVQFQTVNGVTMCKALENSCFSHISSLIKKSKNFKKPRKHSSYMNPPKKVNKINVTHQAVFKRVYHCQNKENTNPNLPVNKSNRTHRAVLKQVYHGQNKENTHPNPLMNKSNVTHQAVSKQIYNGQNKENTHLNPPITKTLGVQTVETKNVKSASTQTDENIQENQKRISNKIHGTRMMPSNLRIVMTNTQSLVSNKNAVSTKDSKQINKENTMPRIVYLSNKLPEDVVLGGGYRYHKLFLPSVETIRIIRVHKKRKAFVFHLESEVPYIKKCQAEMLKFYDTPSVSSRYTVPSSFLKVGLMCAVKIDRAWHRAFVKNVIDGSIEAELADDWISSAPPKTLVSGKKVRFLSKRFADMPAQAHYGFLHSNVMFSKKVLSGADTIVGKPIKCSLVDFGKDNEKQTIYSCEGRMVPKSTFKNMLTSKDPHFSIDSAKIEIGDWCLFEYVFDSKTYYVGKIVEVKEGKVSADFLKFVYKDKDTEEAKFLFKDKGICEADMDQIVVKLGDPILQKSKHRNGHIKFSFDFSAYSLGL